MNESQASAPPSKTPKTPKTAPVSKSKTVASAGMSDSDLRRLFTGILSVLSLLIGGLQTCFFGTSEDWGRSFFLRAGIVLGVMWIAWPSLQRPARWIPPGLLVIFMIGLAMLIVQPKVAVLFFPVIAMVTTVAGILTWFRK